jgi:nucleotide-binding universal stress UspA family protein
MTRFARILCPIDFSQPSEEALQQAEEIARTFGSELVVAHVVEPMIYPGGLRHAGRSRPIDYEDAAKTSANTALQAHRVDAAREGGRPGQRAGRPRARPRCASASLVKEQDFDLVVLATHGYTGLKHVLSAARPNASCVTAPARC